MRLIDTTCPKCNAHMKVDAENKQVKCEFCGAAFMIDDQVQHVRYDNAEEAGYQFEKGRQKAQAEAYQEQFQQPVYTIPVPQQPVKEKKHTVLWVLGWLCCFPVPVMILIWRKKNTWSTKVKIIVTVIFWVALLLIGSANNKSTDTDTAVTEAAIVETEAQESVVDEVSLLTAYDRLQEMFLAINTSTSCDDVERMIQEYGVEYTVEDYNGSPKNTKYKLAYDSKVALQSHADEGSYITVTFNKDNGQLMYAEYFCPSSFMVATYYCYGTYWDFREKEFPNNYSGYYYHNPGETKGGITIEYNNGNSTETGYHPCSSAEEALAHVVPKDFVPEYTGKVE